MALDWIVFEDPAVEPLRAALALGRVAIFTDAHAIEELRDVLAREKFGLEPARQRELLESHRAQTLGIPGEGSQVDFRMGLPPGFPCCEDPDDDCFLALAYRSGAHLLVSRDKAVLALHRRCIDFGFQVATVAQMAAEIEERGAG